MKFRLTSTSQVERTYVIEAADEEQAKKRFTTWKHDPEAFASGIVVIDDSATKDATTQQIRSVETVPEPKPRATSKPKDQVAGTGGVPPGTQAT